MGRLVLAALLLAAAGATSGCGFTPLYATADSREASLGAVAVKAGDERIDYLFVEAMNDKLGVGIAAPEYDLEVVVNERRIGFGIRIDDVATRYESTVSVDYRLRKRSDGQIVLRGRREGVSSYDVSNDPYAELSAEERASERAVELVAEKIRLDLSLHFARTGAA